MLKPELPSSCSSSSGSYRHFCYIGIHTLIAAGLKTLLSCVHVRFQAVHVFFVLASGHLN